MLKHLNGLLCLQFRRRKWVLDYDEIEWYRSIKRFTYGYFFVLKKMVEYSIVEVIPKELVSPFFGKDSKLDSHLPNKKILFASMKAL